MKRIFCLLAVIALCCAMLFACSDEAEGGNNSGGNSSESIDYGSATVYAPGDTVQIIAPYAEGRDLASYISFYLRPMIAPDGSGGSVVMGSEFSPNEKREILIGVKDETRPATISAYRHLERLPRETYFETRYVVYASSGIIAVAYDRNEYTNLQVLDVIEEKIISLFADKDYVALGEGIVMSGTIDLVYEQEELDIIQLTEEWNALETVIGKAATDACRKLYSMYGDDLVEWAANLYDPGTGGFYSTTSGRDGEEFGPDVECTVQLIKFFTQSGMLKNISTDWTVFLPEFMQQQLIYFGKSLQHSNGYFYHPQWGKELVDSKVSRRGRDLGWATTLLESLGSMPQYKAANGKAGDGISADEYWDNLEANGEALSPRPYPSTESPVYGQTKTASEKLTSSLGSSAVTMVSKIVLTADDNPDDPEVDSSTEYLKSYTAFINYLLTKVGPTYDTNPYSMGNTMNATQSQITNSSATLEKTGKYVYVDGDENTCTNVSTALMQFKVNTDSDMSNDMTLADIYKSFSGMNLIEMTHMMLVEKINPEIGLWGKTSAENPTGTEFLFTNGYFKTIGLFTGWGYAYPAEYIPKAANALMQGLLGDQPSTGNICEVYNIWSSIGSLKSNLKYLSSTDYAYDDFGNLIYDDYGRKVLLKDYITERVNTILAENTAAAIENTYNKIKGYKKIDGGFAHAYVYTSGGYATQQGCPTGLRLNDQSNVDATCIGSTGLTRTMFTALGISGYKVSLYTESDWMRILEILLALDPVIKYSYDGDAPVTEYHDYEADVPPSSYMIPTMNGKAGNTFTQVTLNGNGVGLLNKTDNTAQAYLDWKPNSVTTMANVAVFETKIMFTDLVNSTDRIELRLYNGTSSSGTRIYSIYFYNNISKGTVSIAPSTAKSSQVQIAKTNEWFTLSLVYCQSTTIGETTIPACFKVYINGSETPVLVDEKFENGSEIAVSSVGFSRFITMKSFLGKIYLDDTRFAREQRELVYDAPTHNIGASNTPTTPTNPGLPNTGCTVAPVGGTMTFDGVTAFPISYTDGIVITNKSQSKWKGYITAEKEGDNTFIRINDLYRDIKNTGGADDGQPILLIDRPKYNGTDQTFVFEGKFRISALDDGDIKNNATYFVDVTFRNEAETRVYQTYFGNENLALNSDTKNEVKSVYKTGEWFTLRIEYTVIGDSAASASWDVKAYVNDTLVQECSTPVEEKFDSNGKPTKAFCDSLNIDKVGILLSKDFVGKFDLDDIKLYNKPYVAE